MWRGKKDKVSFTMVWNPGSEVDCWCPDRPGKEQDLGVWESFGFKFGRTGWGGGQGGGGECVERGELGCSKGQFQHGLLLPQHPWTPRPLAAELLPPAHGGLTSVWSSDHSSSSLRCQ